MASSKQKSLPNVSEMKQRKTKGHAVNYLRKNKEVLSWLIEIFKWKDSGELNVPFSEIAIELCEYSEIEITGDQVSKAFREWKKKGKF
tara:strand:+ start:1524 stop:1787 length:264 start_codon:yes stop_codon:yes gene_type:complete